MSKEVGLLDEQKLQLLGHNVVRVVDNSDEYMQRALIVFKNGLELSIIAGDGAYGNEANPFEIAPINTQGALDGSFFDEEDQWDDVLGYVNLDKINYYIAKMGAL